MPATFERVTVNDPYRDIAMDIPVCVPCNREFYISSFDPNDSECGSWHACLSCETCNAIACMNEFEISFYQSHDGEELFDEAWDDGLISWPFDLA